MRHLTVPLLAFGAFAGAEAASSSPSSSSPRGVAPEFANHYADPTTFTCISHPSIAVPISAVNDDYCDCPDGSDEPGTSACAHISPYSPPTLDGVITSTGNRTAVPLPGFYCANDGYRPSYLPHNRVNDGICDYDICCDGSDEWAQPGGVRCANRCKQLGAKWRAEEVQRQRSMAAALDKKRELVAAARKKREEVEDAVAKTEVDIQKHRDGKVKALKQKLDEAVQSAEQQAVEVRGKNRVQRLVDVAKPREKSLCDALAETQTARDDARDKLVQLEDILSTLQKESSSPIQSAALKQALRSWDDYAVRGLESQAEQSPRETEIRDLCSADNEDAVRWEEWEKVKERSSGIGAWFGFASEKFGSIVPGYHKPTEDASIEDFPQVRKARDALEDAESTLSSLQSDLESHKASLTKDYWHDDVFRALDGSCVSTEAGEYTYELCWMKSASQKSRKTGMSVGLGNFGKFSTEVVQDISPAHPGKLVEDERLVLQYSDGHYCWNGPNRSIKVIVECGEENRVLKVWEAEICVYSMRASSPAVCKVNGADASAAAKDYGKQGKPAKDEL